MRPKLGAKPSPYDARTLRLRDYLDTEKLKAPETWGYDNIVKPDGWGMLGNDQWGDCVFASAAHQVMLESRAADHAVNFTTSGVLSDYGKVTGFNPNDPNSDQGTVILDALKFRRATGVVDAQGNRHKIGAYLQLDLPLIKEGAFHQLSTAGWLFGAVELGIQVPESAMDEFDGRQMWSYVPGSPNLGGHDVPLVARRKHLEVITWGRVVPVGAKFLRNYVTEAWAIVSPDFLRADGKTPAGFDLDQLNADLYRL